ncbi:serine protease family S33 [Achlya hypogyna]|uniref:Serine protease family S33 n=1 Tax=Achlya hypogyna TaxID=1202772 RepID=A0A1V9ZB70_ACHHY|nr:serine protease family S33 [Achlya hypogyna]
MSCMVRAHPLSGRLSALHRYASTDAVYGSINGTYTLGNGHDVHFTTHGTADATATVVMLHGAPGSFKDFKHLAPRLVKANPHMNVLAIDLPGNGRTSADTAGGQSGLTSTSVAAAAAEAIDGVLGDTPKILLGHSFGGHSALLSAQWVQNLHGIVLLNSVGLDRRPYERFAIPLSMYLRQNGLARDIVAAVNHWRYMHIFKFPKSTPKDDLTCALLRLGSSDFDAVEASVASLRARKLPAFVAYAMDDPIVLPPVGHELAHRLDAKVHVAYPNGGHNLQKTQAQDIVDKFTTWAHDFKLLQKTK